MASLADILFLTAVLGLFGVIFWKGLGGARRGRRDISRPQDGFRATDDAAGLGRRPGRSHGGGGGDNADGGDGGGD